MNLTKQWKAVSATACAIGLAGIGYLGYIATTTNRQPTPDFVKNGTFQGYEVLIGEDGSKRAISFLEGDESLLSAQDYNKDGRFDKIHLDRLSKGHPLEKLATLDELERAYTAIKDQ